MSDQVRAPGDCLKNAGCRTQREWRRWKRAHLRAFRAAFARLRRGCVYTPSTNDEIRKIEEQLVSLEHAWSPQEWGP